MWAPQCCSQLSARGWGRWEGRASAVGRRSVGNAFRCHVEARGSWVCRQPSDTQGRVQRCPGGAETTGDLGPRGHPLGRAAGAEAGLSPRDWKGDQAPGGGLQAGGAGGGFRKWGGSAESIGAGGRDQRVSSGGAALFPPCFCHQLLLASVDSTPEQWGRFSLQPAGWQWPCGSDTGPQSSSPWQLGALPSCAPAIPPELSPR